MSERHPQLRAIEGLAAAIRAQNRVSDYQFTHKGFKVLLSLYNATESGEVITKTGLLERIERMGNTNSRGASYSILLRLIQRGIIEQGVGGMRAPIKPSLAGLNYVRSVEKYLRNMKWADY